MLATHQKKYPITIFLCFIVLYQYLSRFIGFTNLEEKSPLYFLFSPYVIVPLLMVAVLPYIEKVSKKVLILFSIIFLAEFICLWKYMQFPEFPGNFIKNIQYFWGVIIIFPSLYLFLSAFSKKWEYDHIYESFIKGITIIAAAVTIFEFIAYNIVKLPTDNWYLSTVDISNSVARESLFAFRPTGIASYTQPNGLMLAAMTYLYCMCVNKKDGFFFLGLCGILFCMSGTGWLAIILMSNLFTKRPLRNIFYIISFLLVVISINSSFNVDDSWIISRFSWKYLGIIYSIFSSVVGELTTNFDIWNFFFGATVPNFNVGTGITHDWGYFDIFYEQGVIGLILYFVSYGCLVYWSTNYKVKRTQRYYFTFVILFLNSHYPTLNFYVGQMTFSILAALNILGSSQLSFSISRPNA